MVETITEAEPGIWFGCV